MLKFKNSEERHLFWMQGSDEEKDAEVLKKVRKIFSFKLDRDIKMDRDL